MALSAKQVLPSYLRMHRAMKTMKMTAMILAIPRIAIGTRCIRKIKEQKERTKIREEAVAARKAEKEAKTKKAASAENAKN